MLRSHRAQDGGPALAEKIWIRPGKPCEENLRATCVSKPAAELKMNRAALAPQSKLTELREVGAKGGRLEPGGSEATIVILHILNFRPPPH